MAQRGRYYDLDAILAEESPVPVVFKAGVEGCGRALDSSATTDDVLNGKALELQLWLVHLLARRMMVEARQPVWFSARMRRRMQAGAGVEDLHLCPYLYAVAARLQTLLLDQPERQALSAFALETFRTRYKDLILKALTSESTVDQLKISSLLCEEELQHFVAGRQAKMTFHPLWRK